jgi:hypothetical protein
MRHYLICFFTLFLFFHSEPAASETAHDDAEIRCLDCHVTLPFEGVILSYYSDIPSICLGCHKEYPCRDESKTVNGYIHPIGMEPSMTVPDDLVLDVQGKISCITCHFYHDKGKAELALHDNYLRRSTVKRLCMSCHKKI